MTNSRNLKEDAQRGERGLKEGKKGQKWLVEFPCIVERKRCKNYG